MVTVVLWLPGKGHYGGGGPVVPFEVIKIAIKTTGNFKIVQCVGIFHCLEPCRTTGKLHRLLQVAHSGFG